MSRWLRHGILLSLTVILTQNNIAEETPVEAGNNTEPEFVFPSDDTYVIECGSCHIAYPPMLLPAISWAKLMSGIDNHFEENAALDEETSAYITKYLSDYAMDNTSGSDVSHWLKTLPNEPLIRITELPAFIDDHEDAYKRLGVGPDEVGFFSPCKDCHKEAVDGVFSKDRLFR